MCERGKILKLPLKFLFFKNAYFKIILYQNLTVHQYVIERRVAQDLKTTQELRSDPIEINTYCFACALHTQE